MGEESFYPSLGRDIWRPHLPSRPNGWDVANSPFCFITSCASAVLGLQLLQGSKWGTVEGKQACGLYPLQPVPTGFYNLHPFLQGPHLKKMQLYFIK
jgi:hypothetical protein